MSTLYKVNEKVLCIASYRLYLQGIPRINTEKYGQNYQQYILR
jgi:hypothetical protein